MKSIPINFAPNSFRYALYSMGISDRIAIILVIGLLGWNVISAWRLNVLRDTLIVQQREMTVQRMKVEPRELKTHPAPSLAQATAVNNAALQLNIPWQELWLALESSTPTAIGILALEPDVKRFRLHMLAEAETAEHMLDYVANLKKQPFFVSVTLLRHELYELDPQKPMRFQVDAYWSGEAP